ncbi:uncharacterized protein METZ01_LOCUS511089, partial [marine metagenome]
MDLLEIPVPTVNLWRGVDLGGTDAIVTLLSDDDLADLEVAAVDLVARGVDPVDATTDDLPLGALEPLVDELRHEVLHGRGLALLRGFPGDRCT